MASSLKFIPILICLVLGLINNSNCQIQSTNGPEGGKVFCLSQNSHSIFAGTRNGVYRSDDTAKTWIPSNIGIEGRNIVSIATVGDIIFACSDNLSNTNIYRSLDNGKKWSLLPTVLPDLQHIGPGYADPNFLIGNLTYSQRPDVNKLVSVRDTIYALTNKDVYLMGAGDSIWKSTDGRFPISVNELIQAAHTICVQDSFEHGPIAKIFDGDANRWSIWNPKGILCNQVNGIFQSQTQLLVIAAVSPRREAYYLSNDNGLTYQEIKGLENVIWDIHSFVSINGKFFICGTSAHAPEELVYSYDGGLNWRFIRFPIPEMHSYNNQIMGFYGTLLLSNENGIFRSDDFGQTWVCSSKGINHSNIIQLFSTEKSVFAKTKNSLWTRDEVKWKKILYDSSNKFIQSLALGNTVYALIGNQILRSVDQGNSWVNWNSHVVPNCKVNSIAVRGDTLYAGLESLGIFISSDNGLTWNESKTPLFYTAIDFDRNGVPAKFPNNNEVNIEPPFNFLFTRSIACIDKFIFLANNNRVHFMELPSKEPVLIMKGLKKHLVTFNGDSTFGPLSVICHHHKIFLGSNSGVYRFNFYDSTWTSLNNGLYDSNMYAYPHVQNMIKENLVPSSLHIGSIESDGKSLFVTTNVGLFVSGDDAKTWVRCQYTQGPVIQNLANIPIKNFKTKSSYSVKELKITGMVRYKFQLYACTDGEGLFKSFDNGENWTPVYYNKAIKYCKSVQIQGDDIFILATDRKPENSEHLPYVLYDFHLGNYSFISQVELKSEPIDLIGYNDNIYLRVDNGAIFKYENYTWMKVAEKTTGPFSDFLITGKYILGRSKNEVYVSKDSGLTWLKGKVLGASQGTVKWLKFNGHVFLQTRNKIYYPDSNFSLWKEPTGLPDSFRLNESYFFHNACFIVTDAGLFYSINYGRNWKLGFRGILNGFNSPYFIEVSNQLFVQADTCLWNYKENLGALFPIPGVSNYGAIRKIFKVDNRYYLVCQPDPMLIDGGPFLIYSDDNFKSRKLILAPEIIDGQYLRAVDFQVVGRNISFYSFNNREVYGSNGNAALKLDKFSSSDNGKTWHLSNEGLNWCLINGGIRGFLENDTLLSNNNSVLNANSRIDVDTRPIIKSYPNPEISVAQVDSFMGASYLLGTDGNLYRSNDGGIYWARLNNKLRKCTISNPQDLLLEGILFADSMKSFSQNIIVETPKYKFIVIGNNIFKCSIENTKWKMLQKVPSGSIIRFLSFNNEKLYLGTDKGIFTSKDYGDNWVEWSTISCAYNSNLYFWKNYSYLKGSNYGFCLTSNDAKTWQNLEDFDSIPLSNTGYPNCTLPSKCLDVRSGNTITLKQFAYRNVMTNLPEYFQNGRHHISGFYKCGISYLLTLMTDDFQYITLCSEDCNVWRIVDNGLPLHGNLTSIVYYRKQFMAIANNGLFVSIDNGKSWVRKEKTDFPDSIFTNSLSRLKINKHWFRINNQVGLRSDDAGVNWYKLPFFPSGITDLELERSRIWAYNSNKIESFYSDDLGNSWHPYFIEPTSYKQGLNGFAFDNLFRIGNKLYATSLSAISTSVDNGKSWSAFTMAGFSGMIQVGRSTYENNYFIENGKRAYFIIKRTYHRKSRPQVDTILLGDRKKDFKLVANSKVLFACNQHIYRSHNKGVSWIELRLAIDTSQFWNESWNIVQIGKEWVAFAKTKFAIGAFIQNEVVYFRSADGGRSWTPPQKGPGVGFTDMKVFGSYLYGTNGCNYFSSDAGRNWLGMCPDLSSPSIVSKIFKGDIVFALTYDGYVFRSYDKGLSWNVLNFGSAQDRIEKLIDAGDHICFAGNNPNQGFIFYSTKWSDKNYKPLKVQLNVNWSHFNDTYVYQHSSKTLFIGTNDNSVLKLQF